MSTIPFRGGSQPSGTIVSLSILMSDVNDLLSLGFTTIEVWRSSDEGGTWAEVTASAATAASLTSKAATSLFRAGGRTLQVSINEWPEIQPISFSSTIEYWTPQQVVERINSVVPNLATVSGSSVVLNSPTTGRASSLRIVSNDCSDFGFEPATVSYGRDARLPLVADTLSYKYFDVAGALTDRYKWRVSHDGANPISVFSPAVEGSTPSLVDNSLLSIAMAKFVGSDGKAVSRRVVVACIGSPQKVSGYVVGDELPQVYETDGDGFLQFALVRGLKVRVGIEGTSLVREFTVPDSPSFNLLDVLASATDPFTIQVPPPMMNRRSV